VIGEGDVRVVYYAVVELDIIFWISNFLVDKFF
jgi:hypothetical protein